MMRKLCLILLATSAFAAVHDITACRILGDATAVTDTLSATNVSSAPTGWVLECDMTVSGTPAVTFSLGGLLASTANAKVRVHVTGTNPLGGTWAYTLYGTHQLRQVWQSTICDATVICPNDVTYAGGVTATFRLALGAVPLAPGEGPKSAFVFSGDTATVDIDAGAVIYSAVGNNAVSGMSVTNNSTLTLPRAGSFWGRPGYQRITGSTFRVSVIAIPALGAHDGMPLQKVIFTATDAHAHTQTVTVTRPTIDMTVSEPCSGLGFPACYVQEYVADIPSSTFTQADLVTVNYQLVPWIGTILDSSASPCVAAPSPNCSPITFIMDTAATFGTAAAVVDPTSSITGSLTSGTFAAPMMLASGRYVKGGTISGTAAQTCTVSGFNGGGSGATATVALTATNTIATYTNLTITANGGGYTSAPTTGTLGSGTATCSGTITLQGWLLWDLLTQSTSGATAYAMNAPTGGTSLIIGPAVSGTISATNGLTWTGGTSGAVFTQTAGPTANGADSNACAVSEASFNSGSPPPACATIRGGAIKMRALTSSIASPARADLVGTLYLQSSNYIWTGSSTAITASSGTNPDAVCTYVKPFPGVAKAAVQLTAITDTTFNKLGTAHVCIQGLTVNVTAGSPSTFIQGATSRIVWFDHNDLTMTSGTGLTTNSPVVYYTFNTAVPNASCYPAAAATCVKGSMSNATALSALVRGNDVTGLSGTINFWHYVGNVGLNPGAANVTMVLQAQDSSTPAPFYPVLAYNRLYSVAGNPGSPANMAKTNPTYPTQFGGAIIMNQFELVGSATGNILAMDGDAVGPSNNYMVSNNTTVGQRANVCYNWLNADTTIRLRTLWSIKNNIFDSLAIKNDTTPTLSATRVGNWACDYGVGWWGNADPETGADNSHSTGTNCCQPQWPGLHSYFLSSRTAADANSTRNPPDTGSINSPVAYISYVNRRAWDGVTVSSGLGDYRLKSNTPLIGLKPPGGCLLPYDLAGLPCVNSGLGTPGMDEAAARMTSVFF